MSDGRGRRRLLVAATVVFAVLSVLSALAPSGWLAAEAAAEVD